MKKISWIAFLITGLILISGNPVFIVIIAFIFPKMPGEISIPILNLFYCMGVVLLTLSLAKKRMERGTVKANNLLRALTPAQICLIVSMIFYASGMFIAASPDNMTTGGILCVIGMLGVFGAIVLAICRAVYIRKTRQKTLNEVYNAAVARASGERIPDRQKERCERCGGAAEEKKFKIIDGHKFCRQCAEIKLKEIEAEVLKNTGECSICKTEYNKDDMILVDDKYICGACFSARYAGSAPSDDFSEDL